MRTRYDNKFTHYEIELLSRIQYLETLLENFDTVRRERDVYKRLAIELSKQCEGLDVRNDDYLIVDATELYGEKD